MENLYNQLASFLKEVDLRPVELEEKSSPSEQDTSFSSTFLIELIHRIKNTLASVKKFILISEDKFDDREFWKPMRNSLTIKKLKS